MSRDGYLDRSIRHYLKDLASNKPAPGGGSASALAACLGVSLLLMAANFTRGKEKYKEAEQAINKIIKELSNYKNKLESLVDRDVEAYNNVNKYLKLPRSKKRTGSLETSLKKAALVPLRVCRLTQASLKKARVLLNKGNKNLLSDVWCAAFFLKAAYLSAKLNVEMNLRYIKDKKYASTVRKRLDRMTPYFRMGNTTHGSV